MMEKLFRHLDKQSDKDGITAHNCKMVETYFVGVPRQCNKWRDNSNKLRQGDTDGKWTKKDNIIYWGYKNHVKTDTKTKLITGRLAISAGMYDGAVIDKLVNRKEDAGQSLYTDCAYRGIDIEQALTGKWIESDIHEEAYRKRPRTRRRPETKVRVDHILSLWET